MKKRISGYWVQDISLGQEQKTRIRSEIETTHTQLNETHWNRLFTFIERQVELHNSYHELNSVPSAPPAEVRKTLNSIKTHLKKALTGLDSLPEDHHDLLFQYFYLANHQWLNSPARDDDRSAYEISTQKLINGLDKYTNEYERASTGKQGSHLNETFTFFIIELMKFLEKNNYPIQPNKSLNTPFYKLVRAALSEAFDYRIERPENHIETAFNSLHENQK